METDHCLLTEKTICFSTEQVLVFLCTSTAHVKEGEVVLVHAAASGVGTAAIQLVRLLGAVPIVTAGSREKLRMAEALGAAAGFNYKESNFVQGVHDFTGGDRLPFIVQLTLFFLVAHSLCTFFIARH